MNKEIVKWYLKLQIAFFKQQLTFPTVKKQREKCVKILLSFKEQLKSIK